MRVLHVLNELRPSGAETMLRAAAASWRQQGITGEILSTGAEPGEYADVLRQAGYRVHHLPFTKSAAFLAGFFQLVRRGAFDVVHLHTERATFWFAALAWAAGVRRLIRTIHATFDFGGPLRLRRALQRWIMRRVCGLQMTACSESVARVEWERFRNPVTVLGNWFDSDRYPLDRDGTRHPGAGLVLLTVGNCAGVKNHEAVLRALAELPHARYLHAGCEDAAGTERALAEALGVADRVEFLGVVTDLRPVFRAADLFVMPSLHEGFGIAAVEAMGAGVPVLLADVKGLRDFQAHSGAIRYCAPEAAALVRAVQEFISVPPAERSTAGIALSQMAHRTYGAAAGAARYTALYRGESPQPLAKEATA
jgi:glycosyltransferase involved in cell wall biosynthesis